MFEYEKDFVCRAGDGLRRAAAAGAGRGLDGKTGGFRNRTGTRV